MYEPERKEAYYFFIVCAVASLIGWAFLNYYKPIIVEESCSDIAKSSSSLYSKNGRKLDPYYNYENLKARCLEESKSP